MIKRTLILTVIAALVASPFAFADSSQTQVPKAPWIGHMQQSSYGRTQNAEIVAKLTNMSVEDVLKANQEGQTFYEIAKSKGITLDQYKAAMLEGKLSYINEQQKSGTISETQAAEIKNRITQKIENCDGTNDAQGMPKGFGLGGRGKRMNGRQQGLSNRANCIYNK